MALIEIDGLPNLIAWWIFPWQTVSHNQMVYNNWHRHTEKILPPQPLEPRPSLRMPGEWSMVNPTALVSDLEIVELPGLVNIQKTNWKITMLCSWAYKSTISTGAIFKFTNCECLPEGILNYLELLKILKVASMRVLWRCTNMHHVKTLRSLVSAGSLLCHSRCWL